MRRWWHGRWMEGEGWFLVLDAAWPIGLIWALMALGVALTP